jgi:uncharacterized protein YbaA (DUF1428 family)
MAYIDGFLAAVSDDRREEYTAHATRMAEFMKTYGAQRIVETWGTDVPEGKLTSFPMAVQRREGETVIFSWVWWPDRATRDKAWAAMMNDPAMAAESMPFDGQRMVFGGFDVILDT